MAVKSHRNSHQIAILAGNAAQERLVFLAPKSNATYRQPFLRLRI